VPTVGDTKLQQALSIDWSSMTLYHFKDRQWEQCFSVKPN
jgi:hypothetical protein